MKTILNLIFIFLFFLTNCSTKKGNSSSAAALALATGNSSSNSTVKNKYSKPCYTKSMGPGKDANGKFKFITKNYDRRLFTATTSYQKLFTTESLSHSHTSTYVEVSAKSGTVLTFKNFGVTFPEGRNFSPSIGVFKDFKGCSDSNNRFDASRSSDNNLTGSVALTHFTQTGTTSTTARKVTFKKTGTYLLQLYDPGKGHSTGTRRSPAPFVKTDSNEYPTVQITTP